MTDQPEAAKCTRREGQFQKKGQSVQDTDSGMYKGFLLSGRVVLNQGLNRAILIITLFFPSQREPQTLTLSWVK